jgi:hypothetical protein
VRPGVLSRGIVAAVVSLLFVTAVGCGSSTSESTVVGSAGATTKKYDLSGYSAVRIDNAFSATVTGGKDFATSVTVNENLVEYLVVEVEGDTLHIGLKPGTDFRLTDLNAEVTLPSLAGVELSGASNAYVSDFSSGDALALTVSGASRLSVKDVKAGDVTLDVSGAGILEGVIKAGKVGGAVSGAGQVGLTGSVSAVKLDISGGSTVPLNELSATDADMTLSGGSKASVRVSGVLNAHPSGGSLLQYYGTGKLGDVNVAGASQLTHIQD